MEREVSYVGSGYAGLLKTVRVYPWYMVLAGSECSTAEEVSVLVTLGMLHKDTR